MCSLRSFHFCKISPFKVRLSTRKTSALVNKWRNTAKAGCPTGGFGTIGTMSKAFTKEPDGDEDDDLALPPLPAGSRNYM